jgi:hypothetical protein
MRKAFFLITLLLYPIFLIGNINPNFQNQKIKVNNIILAKINDNTISVLDVMKKMDMVFHRSYPQLADSPGAKFQFYSTSWKQVLSEMINTELILAEAKDREVQMADSEIREELENRFGPNIMLTLDSLNLTHDEAWKMLKTELIVRKMSWYNVNSKALKAVTPQVIKKAYHLYLDKNPDTEKWNYQVFSIKGKNEKEQQEISTLLNTLIQETKKEPSIILEKAKDIQGKFKDSKINLSDEYKVSSKEISKAHREVLANLEKSAYSSPIAQKSRFNNKVIHRVFYLNNYELIKAPTFDEMFPKLRDQLISEKIQEESEAYYKKLRKHYGYGNKNLESLIPKDFQPFALE